MSWRMSWAKFERVSDVIVSAPSLTGTSAEDQRFQQMVLDNFARDL